MDLYSYATNISSLCAGCLSENRKLTIITDEESKLMLYSFLEDFNDPSPLLTLCFECKAILRRVIKFKRQARDAHKSLIIYLNQNIKPKCLTKLSQYKNDNIINYHYHNDDTDTNDISITNNDNNEVSKVLNTNSRTKYVDIPNLSERIEPVYVKIENEVEELFLNDDIEVSDDFKNSMKIEDQFQESDDEPLSLVKKKKKRKKKKKKEGNEPEDTEYRVVNSACVQRKLKQLNIDNGVIEMIVLSWKQVEAERTVAFQSPSYTNLQYKCTDCIIGFNHKAKLEKHTQKHLPEAGDIICNICKIRFKNDKSLYAHKRRHRVRWRCSVCRRAWSRAAVCADHAARAHRARPPAHACPRCAHTATSLGKLKQHMREHSEPVSCEICGKTYKDKDTLRTHLFIHKGEKEYQCNKCDKRFLFKKALEIHELTHEGNKFLYCHQCDVTFKNHLSYYQHMKYNLKHIDPNAVKYPCSVCGRVFGRLSRLKEHQQTHTQHTDLTYICTYNNCNKKFPSRVGLRSHTNSVHRVGHTTHTHICHTCGLKYKSKKSLERHMLSHRVPCTRLRKVNPSKTKKKQLLEETEVTTNQMPTEN